MSRKWLLSARFTTAMSVLAALCFGVVESAVLVTAVRVLNVKTPGGATNVLVTILLTCLPAIVGIRGHYSSKRVLLNKGGPQDDAAALWVSRQFIVGIVAAYAAIVAMLGLVTGYH